MNFNDYYDTVTEYEADYSTLLSAWNAGASAMFRGLIDSGHIDKNYEISAKKELEKIIEDAK